MGTGRPPKAVDKLIAGKTKAELGLELYRSQQLIDELRSAYKRASDNLAVTDLRLDRALQSLSKLKVNTFNVPTIVEATVEFNPRHSIPQRELPIPDLPKTTQYYQAPKPWYKRAISRITKHIKAW